MVTLNTGSNYLKVDNVKDGDLITFRDEGTWVESTKYTYPDGNPKQDFVMTVEHNGQDYSLRVNKFSRDELIPVLGQDTKDWVGKQVKIAIETYRALGKQGILLLPLNADKPETKA